MSGELLSITRERLNQLKESKKPADAQLKAFLLSREGQDYILRLVDQNHPLGLFFFSRQVLNSVGEPFFVQRVPFQVDVLESAYPDPLQIVDDSGAVVFSVKPGEKWLQIHVTGAPEKYETLLPRQKLVAFRQELQALLAQFQNSGNTDPQKGITANSVVIGVSHLVKLFAPGRAAARGDTQRQMTWSIHDDQPMPPVVASYFTQASSMSERFGGGEVNQDDLQVLCATVGDLARQIS